MNTSAGTLGRSMLIGGGLISILAEKNAEPAVSAAALHGIGVPPAVTNKSKEMGGQEREEASIVLSRLIHCFTSHPVVPTVGLSMLIS